jgi:hypothetical protein
MSEQHQCSTVSYSVTESEQCRAEQQCASAKLIVDVNIRYILMYAAE